MSDICARVRKNKRKFLYITGIIGGSYAVYKITSFVQNLAHKYQINKNLTFKIQKAQYFQATLVNSIDTIKSIFKNLEHEIELSVDTENVVTTLGITLNNSTESVDSVKQQYATLSADEKLELWQKFKVICFTKLTLLIYCWSFISIAIHIQMSILAGNLFISKNPFTASSDNIFVTLYQSIFPSRNHESLGEKFQLDFINFTLKQIQLQIGPWTELLHKVSHQVVGSVSLKAMLTPDDVAAKLRQIRDCVHNDILQQFLHDLQLQSAGDRLAEIEVFELFAGAFESSGIGHVDSLISLLSRQTSLFPDRKMKHSTSGVPTAAAETETVARMPLARLLPFLWISFTGNGNGDSKMFHSVREFARDPNFRFMLFNAYENAMSACNK